MPLVEAPSAAADVDLTMAEPPSARRSIDVPVRRACAGGRSGTFRGRRRVEWSARAFLLTLAATATATFPSPAQATQMRVIRARTILARIEKGLPVSESGVEVRGALRLPDKVPAPVLLRHSAVDGSISGVSTAFEGPLDLSGTKIAGSLRLPYANFGGPLVMLGTRVGGVASFDFARFEQSALLDRARFAEAALFAGTVFRGPARFANGSLALADFRDAEFADLAGFEGTQFIGASSFAHAEFRSSADFSGAAFTGGRASFSGARFVDGAGFGGAYFTARAALDDTYFDKDGDFRRARFFDGATFAATTAPSVLDFDGATFRGPLDFRSAQIDDAEFSGGEKTGAATEFDKGAIFDQATIGKLNLDGAAINSTLLLPDPRGIGGISSLRMDPADVGHIRAVASTRNGAATQSPGTRKARESALALIETAARAGGDISAANQAEIQRLTLERQGDGPIGAALNWTAGWAIGGYLVRPWHPFIALLVFFVLAATARSWKQRKGRPGLKAKACGYCADLWQSVTAIWRFNPGDGGVARAGEQIITKVLVVAVVLSLGNAEPGVSPIVKGVLP